MSNHDSRDTEVLKTQHPQAAPTQVFSTPSASEAPRATSTASQPPAPQESPARHAPSFAAPIPPSTATPPPPPHPQTVYVAPDGSRIATSTFVPPTFAAPGPPPPPPAPSRFSAGWQQVRNDSTINVGLLVWGVVLAIAGALLILASVFGFAAFRALLVILFVVAGVAFLALAFVVSKQNDGETPPSPSTSTTS